MNKSRKLKYKKYKKSSSITRRKIKGGQQLENTNKIESSNNKQNTTSTTLSESKNNNPQSQSHIDQIKQEVANENRMDSFKSSGILAKTEEIAQGITANTLDNLGEFVGVDLNDPNLVENNKEKIRQMTKNAAEIGAIALEAAKPFTKPLIDKTVEAGGEALSKMGEAGVKVILNTAEEIPGVGVVIGTVRSLSNIGEAIVSSVNAGSEVVSSASDTINASVKNFDRLLQEKKDILNRTQSSVNEFSGGSFTKKYKQYKKYKNNKNNKTKKYI